MNVHATVTPVVPRPSVYDPKLRCGETDVLRYPVPGNVTYCPGVNTTFEFVNAGCVPVGATSMLDVCAKTRVVVRVFKSPAVTAYDIYCT
jgi:hypothetical protein